MTRVRAGHSAALVELAEIRPFKRIQCESHRDWWLKIKNPAYERALKTGRPTPNDHVVSNHGWPRLMKRGASRMGSRTRNTQSG